MSPFDLVKLHKSLYAPSAKHPAIVEVPELAFLMVDGRGDPNTSEAYEQRAARRSTASPTRSSSA